MKTLITLAATGWLIGSAAAAGAQVNCAQVNRYLATGRTVQDVAETMVIPEDDVKKCQAEAPKAPPSGGGAAAGGQGTAGGGTQPPAATGK